MLHRIQRSADFYWKFLKSNFSSLNRPLKLNYAVTYDCNCRCGKCNIWKKDAEELSLEGIRKFFRENDFFRWVSLTGGEPFMREDIVEVAGAVEEESKNLYVLNMPTNGTMPGHIKESVEKIVSLDIPHVVITVSIDGPEEVHDRVRGREGTFEDAIKTYMKLRELAEDKNNLQVVFSYTVSEGNLGEFANTIDSLQEKLPGYDITSRDINVTFEHSSGHYYGKDGNKRSEDFWQELSEINRLKDYLPHRLREVVAQLGLKLASEELKENRLPCVASEVSAFMDPRGQVFPCLIYNEKLGDVHEDGYSLGRIWSEKVDGDFRQFSRKCDDCWLSCESNQRIMANMPRALVQYLGMKFKGQV